MVEKSFMTVEEVAEELRVSKSKAYQIVRELNAELQKKGYLTVAGNLPFYKLEGRTEADTETWVCYKKRSTGVGT